MRTLILRNTCRVDLYIIGKYSITNLNHKGEMMKQIITIAIAVILMFSAVKSNAAIDSTTLNSSVITSNLNLNRTTTYLMKGFNYIRNGATISIPAGTVILGDFETKGTLIIERGSKIFANGTKDCPVVFTSEKAAGSRNPGDWGGVIVLGRSGINTASGADSAEIEGFGPGLGPVYGGQPRIDNDSSGVIRYVRIEFAGINLTGISGNEINSLTMGGVGSRTVIENVQVSYAGDDAFEWFGGNVICKRLIAYKSVDDDFDCDNGFRGKAQFLLSVKDKDIADVSQSNGWEIDNNSAGNYNQPRTGMVFSNVTMVGPFETTSTPVNSLHQRGGHLRRSSLPKIYNSIVMGYRVGFRFDAAGVWNASTGDTIQIRNTILAGNLRTADTNAATSFTPTNWLQTPLFSNSVLSTTSSAGLTSPYNIYPDPSGSNVTNWLPTGGSPALSGADFSSPNLAGFEVVSYKGAFGSVNWTAGWAIFNPRTYALPVPTDFVVKAIPEGLVNVTAPCEAGCNPTLIGTLVNGSCQVVATSEAEINLSTKQTTFCFDYVPTGSYWLVVKYKNSIETWSAAQYSFTSGAANNYDFTTAQSQAYGNNLVNIGGTWAMFSGDVNNDCVVDASDISLLDNDAFNFASGCVVTDLNGDCVVDASDISIADNNGFNFVACFKPCP